MRRAQRASAQLRVHREPRRAREPQQRRGAALPRGRVRVPGAAAHGNRRADVRGEPAPQELPLAARRGRPRRLTGRERARQHLQHRRAQHLHRSARRHRHPHTPRRDAAPGRAPALRGDCAGGLSTPSVASEVADDARARCASHGVGASLQSARETGVRRKCIANQRPRTRDEVCFALISVGCNIICRGLCLLIN